MRRHGGWAKASRASGYYTAGDLDAFFDEYSALLAKYGHGRQDAPPGARLMQLRMFYIPDEPAEPEPRGRGGLLPARLLRCLRSSGHGLRFCLGQRRLCRSRGLGRGAGRLAA